MTQATVPPRSSTTRTGLSALAALVVSGVVASGAWLVLRRALAVATATSAPRVDEVVAVGCAAVALLALLWFSVGVLVAVLGHLPGSVGHRARTLADRFAPAPARRVAAVVAGAVVLGTLAPAEPAGGTDAPRPSAVSAPVDVRHEAPEPGWTATAEPAGPPVAPAPEPGFVPTRPVVRPQADGRLVAAAAPVQDGSADDEVVVHRGDTLWALARAHLGAGATDAEVAAEWPRWHAANRAVIGPDPDLLLPGQVLRVPSGGEPAAPPPHLAPTTEASR